MSICIGMTSSYLPWFVLVFMDQRKDVLLSLLQSRLLLRQVSTNGTFLVTPRHAHKSVWWKALCTYVIAAAHSHLGHVFLIASVKPLFSWLLLIAALARCDVLFVQWFFAFVFPVSESRCCCTSAGQLSDMSGWSRNTGSQCGGNPSFSPSLLCFQNVQLFPSVWHPAHQSSKLLCSAE